MKYIQLSGKDGKGLRVFVDNEDFEYLNQWKWNLTKGGKNSTTSYATRTQRIGKRSEDKKKTIYMHRLIMKTLIGEFNMIVDHINRNTLDNRRENLRLATKSSNACNSKTTKTSKYYGVRFNHKKWEANIWNKKTIYLGRYSSEEEAAMAYNKASAEKYGRFAVLNDCNGKK